MSERDTSTPETDVPHVGAAELAAAERFIEEEEGAVSRFRGGLALGTTALLVVMSLFHLYAAVEIVPAAVLRPIHVGFVLTLVFLLFPVAPRFRNRLMPWDVAIAVLAVATIYYLLAGGDDFWDRNTLPTDLDQWMGLAFVLLVLEACRRTSGWIMTGVVVMFILYALFGAALPDRWAHRGYDIASLSGFLYQTLEGIFGTAFIVQAFKIPTPSMEDNLLVGDHLLVNKFAFGAPGSFVDAVLPLRQIHRGDVIVFKYPLDLSKHYVKRVIGLPGDRIRTVDSQVFINGEPLAEPYKRIRENYHRADFPPLPGSFDYRQEDAADWAAPFRQGNEIVVPPDKYFAMGDNRDNSADSRWWGFVPRELIVGKALIIYWSYESDSDAYRQTEVRDVVRQTGDLVTNFFGKTRWSRTFKIIR